MIGWWRFGPIMQIQSIEAVYAVAYAVALELAAFKFWMSFDCAIETLFSITDKAARYWRREDGDTWGKQFRKVWLAKAVK